MWWKRILESRLSRGWGQGGPERPFGSFDAIRKDRELIFPFVRIDQANILTNSILRLCAHVRIFLLGTNKLVFTEKPCPRTGNF